jgi:hypothetical protein
MSRPPLLHNMSAPPRTVNRHKAAAGAGSALLFQLPPEFGRAGPTMLLDRVTGAQWARTDAEAEAELRRRVNEHAARLPLPPAVLVAGKGDGAKAVDDLLAVYAVLAKSSDRVYLRDKEPNLARIEPGRRVVLRVPPTSTEKR